MRSCLYVERSTDPEIASTLKSNMDLVPDAAALSLFPMKSDFKLQP